MVIDVVLLLVSLAIILTSCIFFSNAVEWLGHKTNMSQGVVGSIFAAVGTALPETLIPIIAIVFNSSAKSHEIGIGAIAGAPFMLSTLAFFVTGFAVLVYKKLGIRGSKMHVDVSLFSRDLSFFIFVYGIAIATTFFVQYSFIKYGIAIFLLLSYGYYIRMTLLGEADMVENLDPLSFNKHFKMSESMRTIIIQLLISLTGIVVGAHLFVKNVEALSTTMGISALILSIIITPIATELPEKLNSVIWVGKKKDTLALGNITGAMVFQSCIPVAFGVAFTPWQLNGITMISALLAFSSAILNLIWIKKYKEVNPYALMFGGVLYIAFLIMAFV